MIFHEQSVKHVESLTLKVMDLEKMSRFYADMLGFEVLEQSAEEIVLGVNGQEMLKLEHSAAIHPKNGRFAGLYHFAILLPNRKELGKVLLHLHEQKIPLGSSDHRVSEALYFSDPEGNGIEIYRDREPAEWEWRGEQVHMTVDPLAVQSVAEAAQGELWGGMPAGTLLGHIHLHVSDLEAAHAFYTEALGFDVVARFGHQALFISDAGYHHHIGLNVWNGTGIPALPKDAAGLSHYVIRVPASARTAIEERLRLYGAEFHAEGNVLKTADPSGNRIHIVTA